MKYSILFVAVLVAGGCGRSNAGGGKGKTADPPQLESTAPQTEVMVLGTFHFAYPNRDAHKTDEKRQVDVLSEKRQAELKEVIERLLVFRPDKIAAECRVEDQSQVDARYESYRAGKSELKVDETSQIAFRMAKELGHDRIYCIDTWGDYERFMNRDRFWAGYEKFVDDGQDSALQKQYEKYHAAMDAYLVKHPLMDDFIALNRPEHLETLQGAYFLNSFSYEMKDYDYGGADWEASRWYDRNLRIFRNIKRITDRPGERIFVLFGAGHHALLRDYIEYSPLHRYVSPLEYLQK